MGNKKIEENCFFMNEHLHKMVYASLMSALIAAGAFVAIPIGPVPIVMQNMFYKE